MKKLLVSCVSLLVVIGIKGQSKPDNILDQNHVTEQLDSYKVDSLDIDSIKRNQEEIKRLLRNAMFMQDHPDSR